MSIVEAEEHKGAAPTLGSAPSQPQRLHAWQHWVLFSSACHTRLIFEIKLTKSFHSSPLIG